MRWGATLALVAALAAGAASAQSQRSSPAGRDARAAFEVAFEVRGLRSDHGRVMGALFDRPERWVRSGEEVARCRTRIETRVSRCIMRVPAGRYAFAFAHDEDGDGELDRDILGIPQEGYGFSNDVRPALSLPSWHSAAFPVPDARPPLPRVVHARYGL
jgi:uncharacterized protein (DUF2141 family)